MGRDRDCRACGEVNKMINSTNVKTRIIDAKNTEYLLPIDDVIRLVAPHDCRINKIHDSRDGKAGYLYVVTYPDLSTTTKVIRANEDGLVQIIVNEYIDKLNRDIDPELGSQFYRGIISHLIYVRVVKKILEDPVKQHDEVIKELKSKIGDDVPVKSQDKIE